ncbi:MAG: hypothetical protein ACLQFR_05265 [Streptosporangiaceae bacterium]
MKMTVSLATTLLAVLVAGAAAACAGLLSDAGAAWAAPAGNGPAAAAARIHWWRAEPVPGLATLNKGYNAEVNTISCRGAGSCVAGGFYTGKHGRSQAFVAAERKGRWGKAEEVPGTAALDKGGKAQVGSVSCARTSVCVAVGTVHRPAREHSVVHSGHEGGGTRHFLAQLAFLRQAGLN